MKEIEVGSFIELWPKDRSIIRRLGIVASVRSSYFDAWVMSAKPDGEFIGVASSTLSLDQEGNRFIRLAQEETETVGEMVERIQGARA
jgi:hypothetical protein